MEQGFSLLEVVFSITIIALLVIFTLPAFDSIGKQRNVILNNENYRREAINTMETAISYGNINSDLFEIKINSLDNGLEKVEVIDRETGKVLLSSYRPQKGFYVN